MNNENNSNRNITEVDLIKSNSKLKDDIITSVSNEIDELKRDKEKQGNAITRMEVIFENMSNTTNEIKEELKQDRKERRKEEVERNKNMEEMRNHIVSIKYDIDKDLTSIKDDINDLEEDMSDKLESKIDISTFEEGISSVSSKKEEKTFRRNLFLTIITTLLTPNLIIFIIDKLK